MSLADDYINLRSKRSGAKPRNTSKQRAPDLEAVLRGEDDPRSRDVRTRGRDIPPTRTEARLYDRLDERNASLVPLHEAGGVEDVELLNYPDGAVSFEGGFEPASADAPQDDRALERAFGRRAPEGFPEEWFNPEEPSLADTRLMGAGRRRLGQDSPAMALAFDEPMAEPPSMDRTMRRYADAYTRDQEIARRQRDAAVPLPGVREIAPLFQNTLSDPDLRRRIGEQAQGLIDGIGTLWSDAQEALAPQNIEAAARAAPGAIRRIPGQVAEGAPRAINATGNALGGAYDWILDQTPEGMDRGLVEGVGGAALEYGDDIIRMASYGPWEDQDRLMGELERERALYRYGLSDGQAIDGIADAANAETAYGALNLLGGAWSAPSDARFLRGLVFGEAPTVAATQGARVAPQVAMDAPFAFEGAPRRLGPPIEAEARPMPARAPTQRIEGPEGSIEYEVRPDGWHIRQFNFADGADGTALYLRLEEEARAATGQGLRIGQRHAPGSARLEEPRPVRIGEQVNADGSVSPASPIDWENGATRLPEDQDWFEQLAGYSPRLGDNQPRSIDARAASGMPQRRLGSGLTDVNANPARPVTEAGTNADSAPMRGTGNVREPERFWDDRLTDQQNAVARWAMTGRNAVQISDEMIREGVQISPETVRVQLNRIKARTPDVYDRIGPGRTGRAMSDDTMMWRAVRIYDELAASGQGGRGSTAIIAERLGIEPRLAKSHVAQGNRLRRLGRAPESLSRNSSDPLGSIAAPAAVGVGTGALLLGGEAEAQDMDGLEPLPEDVNLRDEGEWLGSWFQTTLPDGSGGIARVIRGPDGTEYTIVGRQAEDLSIDVLGVRPVGANPPGPPSPRVGEFGPRREDISPDMLGWDPNSVRSEDIPEERGDLPLWLRAVIGGTAGLVTRGGVRRLGGGRGVADVIGAATALGTDQMFLGGADDPLGSLAVAATPFAATRFGEFVAPRVGGEIGRMTDEAALLSDPAFLARRDAFAQTLDDAPPMVRRIEADQASAIDRRFLAPQDEMLNQGFSIDRPSSTIAGQRTQFLEEATPREQLEWMNRVAPERAPDVGRIGFASGVDDAANARPRAGQDEPIPDNLDDIAPQPRGFRASPDDIMANPDRATLSQPARLRNMLATLAEQFGVEVPRGARGGVQAKALGAALARAAQSNPALRAELRRRGLWSVSALGVGVAASNRDSDPLAGIAHP